MSQSRTGWPQSDEQCDHNEGPNHPISIPPADYMADPTYSGLDRNNGVVSVTGPSTSAAPHAFVLPSILPSLSTRPYESPFPRPPVGYPAASPCGLSMSNYPIHRPTRFYPGSYPLAATADPPSSFVNCTPPTNINPPRMLAPSISHLGNAGATNTLGPNAQGHMVPTFMQSPLPTTSNQVPFFPQSPSRYTTDNALGPTYSSNEFAACNRTQEPMSGSRLNHIPDPEVHEVYRSLRLQAALKDPKNQQPTVPVEIRREKKVVLGLTLHSDSYPISDRGWEGIQLPQTGSVKSGQQTLSGELLRLSIHVFGGSTGAPNAEPCSNCWDREQQAIDPNVCPADLQPYMIDFRAENLTTVLSGPSNENCLKADITFRFTCYSNHHEGTYKLIVKLHDESWHLVAHSLLPYEFIVKANGNGVGNHRTRPHRGARQQALRSVFNPLLAPGLEPELPELSVDPYSQRNPPVLRRLSPADGPVSGGPIILISGINFPPPTQQIVYVRFGSVVVPTSWQNPYTLECQLPSSPTSGTVQVTLSLHREPGRPQFGQGHCLFKYHSERDYFYAILRAIAGQEHGVTPETWDSMIPVFLQHVSPAGRVTLHDATRPDQSTSQISSIGAGEMERWTIQFLTSLAESPGWENTVSLVNEHHQTLAHLAVIFRHPTLLAKVAQWGIDVDVQDVNGFTALHCAYLCGDFDSIGVLKGYGADEDIQDSLGRRPLDMYMLSTNNPGTGSPSSDRTSSSAQIPSTDEEDWEEPSMASQSGSLGDHETTMDLPASRHEPLRMRQLATVDGVSELNLSGSSASLGHDPSPSHVPNLPVNTLQYLRGDKQEPKVLEIFNESNLTDHRNIQSTPQQAISKYPMNSQNAGNDRDSPDPKAPGVSSLARSSPAEYESGIQEQTSHPQSIMSSPQPAGTALGARNRGTPCYRAPISAPDDGLTILERIYNSSEWLANHDPEPVVGHPTCPKLAEEYGIRGKSCYTVFVEDKLGGTYGCRYERCRAFLAHSLDDAVRHQRTHHFDHRPFLCTPHSGKPCNKRFSSHGDLQKHQQHCW